MDVRMCQGANKSFYVGSSAFTKNLTKSEYDGQRVTILKWVPEKQRWAVRLYLEGFNGKELLVTEDKLCFDHFVANDRMELPGHLELKEAPMGGGEALFALQDIEEGQVVFEEYPMMVVNSGIASHDSRWNLYFGVVNEKGQDAPILKAFDRLSDGNQPEKYIVEATTLFTKMMIASVGAEATFFHKSAKGNELFKSEVWRIASVIARWHTNSHEFYLRGDESERGSISAIFYFGAKMQHSCEPNVSCTVDLSEGIMTVRALRKIKAGELLGNSYMGWGTKFNDLSLRERREKLRMRGFVCHCSRCIREQDEMVQQMAAAVAGVMKHPH